MKKFWIFAVAISLLFGAVSCDKCASRDSDMDEKTQESVQRNLGG